MDFPSLALVVAKATVLLAAGGAIAALLRRAPAATRHVVWLVTVAGVLALPAVIGVAALRLEILPPMPGGPVAVEAPRFVRDVPPAAVNAGAPARSHAAGVAGVGAVPVSPPATGDRAWSWPSGGPIVLAVWLIATLVLLGRLAAGVLAVRRIVRRARPLADSGWEGILCDAADRLGLAVLPRLVSSDRVDMPFASGVRRGTIVLPSSADQWSEERRRVVLFHELAHMRRRDLVGHLLGRLACAVYWFHPLVWTAARRLRAESERACDDLVLACGTRPSEYAGHLLEILTAARRPGELAAAVAMARRTEFEGRMLAILDPAAARGVLGRFRSAALASGLAFLFLTVAALAPQPVPMAATRAAETAAGSVTEKNEAQPPQAASPANPRYARRTEREERRIERRAEAAREREEDEGEEAEEEEEQTRQTPEQAALLARVLRTDTDTKVRRSAAWALAPSDGLAVEALVTALKSDADAEVREMAAWALAEARGDAVSSALTAALQGDGSDGVRAIAAWALGQRPRTDTAALVAAVGDRAPKVRETAIWALGNQELETAPAPVVSALRDADASMRMVAAWALGQIADPASATALRAAFKEEKDDKVRQAFFHALMLVGDRSPEVIEQVLKSDDPDLRAHAVRTLSRGGGIWPWPWPRPEPRPFP